MIEIIPNQPIIFRNVDEISSTGCECNEQPFCQIINPLDPTQFQIKSLNNIINGSFFGSLDGWDSGYLGITGIATITNESAISECNGSVTISASGGITTVSDFYSFSFMGGSFEDNDMSITYNDLCSGDYWVTIQDSEGNQTSVEFTVSVNITCGLYDTTDELLPFKTSELLNCLTSDFI